MKHKTAFQIDIAILEAIKCALHVRRRDKSGRNGKHVERTLEALNLLELFERKARREGQSATEGDLMRLVFDDMRSRQNNPEQGRAA